MKINNVFVLGSGFSASMGLPTLRNLFKEIMDHRERPGEKDKEKVIDALDLLYPSFNKDVPTYPPYEEFLSLIFAAKELSNHLGSGILPNDTWHDIEKSALRLLFDYIDYKSSSIYNDTLLKGFVEKLRPGNVIITFNWDTLIEKALLNLDKNSVIVFNGLNPQGISILKLHGSISWFQLRESEYFRDEPDICWLSESERICYMKDFRYFDAWDALGREPFIIPPIATKSLSDKQLLGNIWIEAFDSLVNAERINIIGYSLPKEDLQARALLVSALALKAAQPVFKKFKYRVINPDIDIYKRYNELISPNVEHIKSHFTPEILDELFGRTPISGATVN